MGRIGPVLPLLDGLDEVKAGHRAACVDAINAFRQSHGLLPLAVTSRAVDYEALEAPAPWGHPGAAPDPRAGERLPGRPRFRRGARPCGDPRRPVVGGVDRFSPLLLNIVTLAYAGQTEVNRSR